LGRLYCQKYTIHCPIIDTVTLLYTQQYSSVLEVAAITKSGVQQEGYRAMHNLTES